MGIVIGLFLLFVTLIGVLNLPYVKNELAQRGLQELNKEFNTQIFAKEVEVDFLGRVHLKEISIKDHHNFEFIKSKSIIASLDIFSLVYGIFTDFEKLEFTQITLQKPDVKVITYKGEEADNFLLFIDKFDDGKEPTKPSTFKFLSEIDVFDGKLSIINQNLEEPIWLDAENLNISVNNLKTIGSNVWLNVVKFNFNAKKNGENYQIKQLGAQFFYSKKEMKFKDLVLETDSSLLNGSLDFNYTSVEDLSDFNNKVVWNLNIVPTSEISGKDIRYFSKNWNTNAKYKIQSLAKGTLNNLALTNLQLVGNQTSITANSFHLSKILESNFELNSKNLFIKTSDESLKSILPSFISKNLKNHLKPFQTMSFKGDAKINPKEINANGNFNSALGICDFVVKLYDYTSNLPKYKGNLKTNQMNISSLIGDDTVKNFAGEISFNGKGFDIKKVQVDFNAKFNRIHLLNYHLTNQQIKGNLNQQIFTGNLISNDVQAKYTADAKIDFSSSKIKIATDATIEHLNMYHFGLSKIKGEVVSSKINGIVEFSNLNDIQAKVKVNEFILNSPVNSIVFNELELNTFIDSNGRFLNIDSPSNIKLTIQGKYNLKDLPNTILDGIGGMIVGYKPRNKSRNQNYTFDIEIEDSFLELFVKDISFNTGTRIFGSYQGKGNLFNLNLTSPRLTYQNITSENLNVNFNTSDSINKMSLSTDLLAISDKFIRQAALNAQRKGDTVFANTQFFIEKELKDKFDLNLYQTRTHDLLQFGFLNSSFKINQNQWEINPKNACEATGSYDLKSGMISIVDLILQSNGASVAINGNYKSLNDINLSSSFKEVDLKKFIPADKLGDIELDGIANGIVDFKKIGNDYLPYSDLIVKNVKINKIPLGDLNSKINFNETEKILEIDTQILNENVSNLTLKGKIFELTDKPKIDLLATFDNLKTDVLGSFLKGVVSNLKGNANGEIKLDGELSNPNYNGTLQVSKFGFKVDYLGVNYLFEDNQNLQIYSQSQQPINVGNIYIEPAGFYTQDGNTKRTGSVYGIIQTIGFSKWFLNLDFDSDNLMVLNTTSKQNELFYGKVFAKGNFNIHGVTDRLTISADAHSLEGSQFSINTGATSDVEDESKILIFKKPEKIENKKIKENTNQNSGLTMDFRISVDDKTKINVVLDANTRDEIVAQGISTDKIRFKMFPNGNITMNGKYEVKQGSKYNFKRLFDKVFIIEQGSTIVWNGDPYDADLNIIASQTKQVSNAGDFLQISNVPVIPVDIKVVISDKLSEPKINFKVQAPKAPQQVKEELFSRFANNPDLERNQFGVILLTSKFLTENSGVTGVKSSAYEVALSQMIAFLNNISSDVQFDLEVVQADQLSNTASRLNSGVKINLSPRVKVKSSVGVPFGATASANNQLTAEGELEWDISKRNDNSLIIRGFSRPTSFGLENFNIGTTQLQSYGVGIVYRKSFNTFREFLGLPKKTKDTLNKK